MSVAALSRLGSNIVDRGRQTLRNRGVDLLLHDPEFTLLPAEGIISHY